MEAEIILKYKGGSEAEAVAKAVSPDNLKVPKGLSVRTVWRGSVVITVVRCEKGLETLFATVDDLLACVQAAEGVVKTLKITRKR